jgi:polyhydroxyalkanoate synthesis regulator phasin
MTTPTEKKDGERARGPLYETTRTVLLAGIGAVSLAQDEVNNFLDRLVERGEMAEADARKLVREVTERREKLEQERRSHLQEGTRAATNERAATRADIEALNARVLELTRQIEELRRQTDKQA